MVKSAMWKLEPHTAAKHELLVRYLGAWFPILSVNEKRVVFLDAFAGPGVYVNGEPGSPEIALKCLLDHSFMTRMAATEFVFIFNEMEKLRFEKLQQTVAAIEAARGGWPPNVRVAIENREFVSLAGEMLASLEGERLAPTFAFIDPFGYKGVPMATIADLLTFNKCELFIYFDYNSVNRFGTAGMTVDAHFEMLFGTDRFKNAPPAGDPLRGKYLHDLYAEQLRQVCKFPYVRSFEMVGKNGHTNNYLFYCTRHLKGLARMKDAMWKVAPGGDYRFSDLTGGQEMLMSPDADLQKLMDILAREFAGLTVSYREVEDFVVEHTHFAPSHIKTQTLKPMQESGRVTAVGQKRRGTFPEAVRITFPK